MKSILIVEDSEDMRMIYEYMFREESGRYVIEIVSGPLEALERLREKNYDLLISDIIMDSMSGEHFLNSVKQDGKNAGMPILVVSVLKAEMLNRLEKEGNIHFLQKPVRRDELLGRVKTLA